MEKLHLLRSTSLKKKVTLVMVAVLLMQAVVFSCTVLFGGTVQQLNNNAFDIFNERVINRKNYLQNEMVDRWSNISDSAAAIKDRVKNILYLYGTTHEQIGRIPNLDEQILSAVNDDLVYLIRRNMVSGAFLILGGDPVPPEGRSRTGLYLRDLDPVNTPSQGNSDLLVACAPANVTRTLGIALDAYWTPDFAFEKQGGGDYFYEPLNAAIENPQIPDLKLGYWSRPFRLDPADIDVITFSLPLRSDDGTLFGVLGVELSLDYLRTQLPSTEINSNNTSAYLLAVDRGAGYERILSSGPAYGRLFGGIEVIERDDEEIRSNCYKLKAGGKSDFSPYGCIHQLHLYATNTPFVDEQWVLIGISSGDDLLRFSHDIQRIILVSLGASLLLGTAGILVAGIFLTHPITALVRQVRESDPSRPTSLPATKIAEIDELSGAIEALSLRVADAASKLTRIIDMVGIPIGAFEYEKRSGLLSFTAHFFEVIQLAPPPGAVENPTCFWEWMRSLAPMVEERSQDKTVQLLHTVCDEGKNHWVRMKLLDESERILCVVTDVTQEINEKHKIEIERDYDLLTGLYNRRAFERKLQQLFSDAASLKTAAVIMLDLDNLKYINDTYGHDYGDSYIRCTADVLRRYTPAGSVLSRISGDEFHICIFGFNGEESLRQEISRLRNGLLETPFPLPDGKPFRIRASAGVAWYPRNGSDFEQLFKYADFAMYKVKNTIKGEFSEFDRESYERDSYLVRGKEDLNQLIDEQLVEYCFQPIVDVCTGKPIAYEALMRSMLSTLKSPAEILNLARSQGKLYQIERLTWFKSVGAFSRQRELAKGCRLFVNSVANQQLKAEDLNEFEKLFQPLLQHIVLELTEGEQGLESATAFKRETLRRWGGKIALDDFGTGYNSELALITVEPDYVKIDMSIVRNVDLDPNRQAVLKNLIAYSRERQIKTIAEGVETRAEMETVVRFGVDYIQGYFLARPSFEIEPPDENAVRQMIEVAACRSAPKEPAAKS